MILQLTGRIVVGLLFFGQRWDHLRRKNRCSFDVDRPDQIELQGSVSVSSLLFFRHLRKREAEIYQIFGTVNATCLTRQACKLESVLQNLLNRIGYENDLESREKGNAIVKIPRLNGIRCGIYICHLTKEVNIQ